MMRPIQKMLIVGAGTMGQQIALQCALFDVDVIFYDLDDTIMSSAVERLTRMGRRLIRDGHLAADRLQEALSRISTSTSLTEAAHGVDLVSESIPEDLELKRRVWSAIGSAAPDHAILTTNTSTLRPSDFAESTGAPERFLAWHFHLPAFTANVVDVMPHPGTDPALVDAIEAFSRRVGQLPIIIRKEHPEYVFNTMLVAFLNAALRLAANDVASIEDIDRSWMKIMGTPQGPFGIIDMIGIDTVHHVTKEAARKAPDHPGVQRLLRFLEAKIEAGEVGMKKGRGFYTYPAPAFADEDFLSLEPPEEK